MWSNKNKQTMLLVLAILLEQVGIPKTLPEATQSKAQFIGGKILRKSEPVMGLLTTCASCKVCDLGYL